MGIRRRRWDEEKERGKEKGNERDKSKLRERVG